MAIGGRFGGLSGHRNSALTLDPKKNLLLEIIGLKGSDHCRPCTCTRTARPSYVTHGGYLSPIGLRFKRPRRCATRSPRLSVAPTTCRVGKGMECGWDLVGCSGLPDPRQVETGCLLPSLQSPLSSTRRTSAKRTRLFGRTRAATLGHHKRLPWEHYTAPTIQHSSTRGGDNANALSPTRTIQTRRPPPQEPKKPKAEKRASRPFRAAVALFFTSAVLFLFLICGLCGVRASQQSSVAGSIDAAQRPCQHYVDPIDVSSKALSIDNGSIIGSKDQAHAKDRGVLRATRV